MRALPKLLFSFDKTLLRLFQSPAGRAARDLLDQSGLWEPIRNRVSRIRRRAERFESYRDKVQREQAYFSGFDVESNTAHNWQGVARAMYWINRTLGAERGEIEPEYLATWVQRRFGPISGRGLDLGCGPGDWPRRLLDAHQGEKYHAFDVNESWIAAAQRDPRNHGYPIQFFVADANQVAVRPRSYSVIFAHDALHHFQNLEHVIEQIAGALVPGGRLIVCDFVGPSRMQWTDYHLQVANGLLQLLPAIYRRLTDGRTKQKILRPDPTILSPFEAIRSAEIMPLLSNQPSLHLLEAHWMCGLQPLVFTDLAPNFAPDDEFGNAFVDLVWHWEQALHRTGHLQGNHVVAVYEKCGDDPCCVIPPAPEWIVPKAGEVRGGSW